jgi:hypothetical protein
MVAAMSGTNKILLAMLLGSVTASGCMYVGVTPSVAGRAYVVKQKGPRLAGESSLWNCDATSGTPTCYRVKNVPNGPVTVPSGGTTPTTPTASAGANTNE